MHHRYGRNTGFTIVELLVVIVVIAILASITIVTYNGIQNRAHNVAVQSDLRQTISNILIFESTEAKFPATNEEINGTFVATRNSYIKGTNGYLYCTSGNAAVVIGRSISGEGYYHSTATGAHTFTTWPGNSHMNLCPAAGMPPGYRSTWILLGGSWQEWFRVGS